MSSSHASSSGDEVGAARASEGRAFLRHGAYICVTRRSGLPGSGLQGSGLPGPGVSGTAVWGDLLAAIDLPALAARLRLRNEFEAEVPDPPADVERPAGTIAFLRRLDATPGDIADAGLLQAEAIIHVSAESADIVQQFCEEARHLLEPRELASCAVLRGGVRPTRYTSASMHGFAYASQRTQESGRVMPHAFLLPLSKTAEWWAKDWMERHTYFLPAYDESGRMTRQGHMLAAAPGVPTLMRRTYMHDTQPAPEGDYDFVTYFECADEDVASFHAVCAGLRDVEQNPEWRFVREGPCWHGRRVASWRELFT